MAALVLGGLLAGCTAKDDGAEKGGTTVAPPATVTDETGAIEGVVVDQNELPVVGAEIGLRGESTSEFVATAESDSEGKFTFSELVPGVYGLLVQQLGYDDTSRKVEVLIGEVTDVGVVRLVEKVSAAPFSIIRIERGIFGCGVAVRPVVAVAVCGVIGIVGDEIGFNTSQYDRFLIEWYYEDVPVEAWDSSVFEMKWTSNQAFGRGLRMIVEQPNCFNACAGQKAFADISGPSPLRVYLEKDDVQKSIDGLSACEDSNCTLMSRVFSTTETLGSSAPADVGIAIQQPYEQAISAYFYGPAPVDWTALES